MDVSVLRPFSYGMVAYNNDSQNRTIYVKMLEHLPQVYGKPNLDVDTATGDIELPPYDIIIGGVRRRRREITTRTVVFKDWVPANWLNRDANRISPPKVVVGQRVLLWRVGDSNQYYWEELDVDMRLKPDEHIVIAINNHNDGEALTIDNAYFIELSTRDQRIRLRTNTNNGEASAFHLDLNGKAGIATLVDNKAGGRNYSGNGFTINSNTTTVSMKNVNGSSVTCDKTNITHKCSGTLTIDAGKVIINGETTVNDRTEFKSEVTFGKEVTFVKTVTGADAHWSIICTAPNI